ncbi:hypothetical protein ACHAXT_012235 [Thalassiosira profunda]
MHLRALVLAAALGSAAAAHAAGGLRAADAPPRAHRRLLDIAPVGGGGLRADLGGEGPVGASGGAGLLSAGAAEGAREGQGGAAVPGRSEGRRGDGSAISGAGAEGPAAPGPKGVLRGGDGRQALAPVLKGAREKKQPRRHLDACAKTGQNSNQCGGSPSKPCCEGLVCTLPLDGTCGGTASPTVSPTTSPTESPTKNPTESPTKNPTESPTKNPTESPTKNPTESPTKNPTESPTKNPTESPTKNPTESPTKNPTKSPTKNPTESPTKNPTESPTKNPTESPTKNPTESPTKNPTESPTKNPTESPTKNPTESPTKNPTESPTRNPAETNEMSTPNDAEAKERRKQLRRDRIVRGGTTDAPSDEQSSPNETTLASEETVSASFKHLDTKLRQSTDLVTEARVKTDQREAQRRDEEQCSDQKREELLAQVDDAQQDDTVTAGWKQCQEATNAQDLVKLLDNQQSVCETALARLERIGQELGTSLREKDHDYVTALKRNRLEVEAMQQTIAEEHAKLKEAFERELKLIEESLAADRDYILNTNRDELDALLAQRERAEAEGLERQRQIIDEHRRGIEESETKGEQDREALQRRLEDGVRHLEIDLEDTRARHDFDTDKLEHNVRVLAELSEHSPAANKQKRRILKGKEELARELEGRQRAKALGLRQNEALEGACERIEAQSGGLRDKFERFRATDDEKYRAVRGMHRDDLQQLQGELLRSQEFIFEGAIGCAEQSCTSEVTNPSCLRSNRTNECKMDASDELGLESEGIAAKGDDWTSAESLMSNYRAVLERRECLRDEAVAAERQNEKLEEDLHSRLTEEVSLAYPPSVMISVGDGAK